MFRTIGLAAMLVMATPAAAVTLFSDAFVMVSETGPGRYSFVQTGFGEGASISGMFEAVDLNGNFQIGFGELIDFSAVFSGNSLVPAISFDKGVLIFDLDGSGLLGDGIGGDIEGAIAFDSNTGASWRAGPGPFNLCGAEAPCGYIEAGAVPEPASWALLIAGLGLTGGTLRQRRAKAA